MSPKKQSKTPKGKNSTSRTTIRKMSSNKKKDGFEDVVIQLADDLAEYLANYSEHININNTDVQNKIEELAETVTDSMSDFEDADEDEFLTYEGDMDQYGDDDDD